MSHRKASIRWIIMMQVCVLLAVSPVSAGIYKYTDDKGEVHFTDDKSKIPLKYRTREKLETVREVKPVPLNQTSFAGKKTSGARSAETIPEEKTNPDILTLKEKSAMEAGIAWLANEIERGKKIIAMPPSERNGQNFVATIQSVLSAKRNLLKRVSGLKPPALKALAGYLKTSVAADASYKTLGPRFKSRTIETQNRLKGETKQAAKLIKQLETAIKKSETASELAKEKAAP